MGKQIHTRMASALLGVGLLPVVAAFGGSGVLDLAYHAPKPPAPASAFDQRNPVGATGFNGINSTLSDQILQDAGSPAKLSSVDTRNADLPSGELDIPAIALDAYHRAESSMARIDPACHIPWYLIAGIGRIESGHADGGAVDVHGTTVHAILGPVLNGGADTAAISDTDGGRLDGDNAWDRAVGPMQFIPGTWSKYASDGNGDGISSPSNLFDSALAAGKYLCAAGGDLSAPAGQANAVFSYNHADSYVRTVLLWADAYAKGVRPLNSALAASVGANPPLPAPGKGNPPAGSQPHPTPTPPPSSGQRPQPTANPIPQPTPPPTTTTPQPTTTPPPTTTTPPTTTPPTTTVPPACGSTPLPMNPPPNSPPECPQPTQTPPPSR